MSVRPLASSTTVDGARRRKAEARHGREVVDYLRARPLLGDSLLALALLIATTAATAQLPSSTWRSSLLAMTLANAVATGFVAIRRRWTWIAVAGMSAHAVAAILLDVTGMAVGILVVTFTAASRLPVRQSVATLVLLWVPGISVAAALDRFSGPGRPGFVTSVLFDVMMALVAYLTGRVVFTRRRYVAALMERARTAEQNQQALAAQAVGDERRRIARELHDMVAHHVSVMGVLATGSRRLLRKDPDTADEALATIEETSRTALREMRRLLDVLRTDPEPVQPLAPQPGLAGLHTLAEQVREAGVPVAVRCNGEAETLDPGIALTVYRIVQEALTNVLKHGGAQATAEVRLDFEPHWLTVEVFDTGRGPSLHDREGVGHGLVGMRERVSLFGGMLRTGPRPGGGFRVYARIPIEDDPHRGQLQGGGT